MLQTFVQARCNIDSSLLTLPHEYIWSIRRVCKISKEGVKVHAPKYQKLKDEGCVGVVGNPDTSCENFVNIQPGSEPIMSNS